ncbi:hypothetical protein Tco_0931603 [Tanacetum coccineum]
MSLNGGRPPLISGLVVVRRWSGGGPLMIRRWLTGGSPPLTETVDQLLTTVDRPLTGVDRLMTACHELAMIGSSRRVTCQKLVERILGII